MSVLIKRQSIVADTWQTLDATDTDVALPEGDILFPLAFWQTRKDEILARYPRLGLWLEPDTAPVTLADLAEDLPRFTVIAVHFPKFSDGRGYSIARLLRERYHYTGELRAVGDVLHDQLFSMRRVGFDAWALKEGKDARKALQAFSTFKNPYQGDVQRPPLFRRKAATGD
jgi:uncharacterized protein (DUF934 family)